MSIMKKFPGLNEKQCYARLYGTLIFEVPHYYKSVEITKDGGFIIKYNDNHEAHNMNKDVGYTLEDLMWREVFWGGAFGNTKQKWKLIRDGEYHGWKNEIKKIHQTNIKKNV